jgi:aspartyl-tRNA(Asn)/glutamyl-tRNA(Gln) amidotransferase subunit A
VLQEARGGEADRALDGVDVLAVPTMPSPPPTIEEVRDPLYDVRRTVYTSLLDLTGQPVITVPCGLTSTRLPTGISFVARRWEESSALRAARAYELVRGPFPTPPVSSH